MKLHQLLVFASLFGLAIDGAGAVQPSNSDKVTPGAKPVAVSPESQESALTKAMPADVVRKIMGAPNAIKPMKAPDGKAEIWVYHPDNDQRRWR